MECVLENITIHYEVFGEGRPIIILPGWSMNTRLTAYQMESYFLQRQGWKRIYIDPPGHGRTSGRDWITDLDKILDVLLACIDKLTAGGSFCLVGVSLGAYMARGVLLKRTKFVNGIAMLVPVVIAEDEKRTTPPYTVVIDESLADMEVTQEEQEFLGMAIVRTRKWLQDIRNEPQVPTNENGDPEFLTRIREDPKKYAFSFDVDALPQPFQYPSLIVAGRQDHIVGYRDAWHLLKNFPRASYVVLDRMGHFMEESESVVSILTSEWLDRVEEYTMHVS